MVTQDVDLVVDADAIDNAARLLEEEGFRSERFEAMRRIARLTRSVRRSSALSSACTKPRWREPLRNSRMVG